MAKNLLIVESPAKAKTIEGYLGKDFLVKSSYGHIRDLAKGNNAIDVANNFAQHYEVPADKKAPIETALTKLKEAHKTQDAAQVDAALAEMNAAWTAASEDIYKAQQAAGEQGGGAQANAGAANTKDETVTDAEFEEVK